MNLNQVTIPSLDVESATTFYSTLGLHLIVDALPRYVRFVCPEGDATFSIHNVENIQNGEGITVYFEEDNLDKKVKDLQEKGIVFTQLPIDQPWLWREAHLKDLDGHRIILFQAGKNRIHPPWGIN